ncbi:MAG TPA: hypothetical protein VFZ58_03855 [Candidatus Saccharimonadales bacterium]
MSRLLNKHRWLHIVMVVVAIVGQLFSYMPPVQAEPGEPGPYGRPLNYGYFFGRFDGAGQDVIPGGLFPGNIDQFVNAIRSRALNLGGGWSLRDIRGAQFIVQTMRGGGYAFPSVADVNDWEQRVRGVASYGGVNLDEGISFNHNSYYQDAHGDDAFYTRQHGAFIWYPWTNDSGIVGNSITFRDQNGNIIYAIRKACGNPVGSNFAPLPNPWQFYGTSTVSGNDQTAGPVSGRTSITSVPGTTVTFSHFLRLEGTTAQQVDYNARRIYPGTPDQSVTNNSLPRANPGVITMSPGSQVELVRSELTIPLTATPGTQYCQYLAWRPVSSTNGGTGLDVAACVVVAYSYSLSPSAQSSQTTATANDTISMTYSVRNTGLTMSRPTFWAVKELVVSPGTSIDLTAPYTDNNFDCARFAGPGIECRDIYATPGPVVFNGNATTPLPNGPYSTYVVGNYPAGTRVCRMLAVDPPTHADAPRHRWSTPSCVVVGKRPTVHFMGGDISVGGGFANASGICSVSNNSGNIFTSANTDTNGSVVEYAAVARGKVQQFGTASKPDTSAQHFLATALMFANVPLNNPGNFGDNPHCIPDYYEQYAAQVPVSAAPVGPQDIGGLVGANSTTKLHYGGNLTIARSTIPKGSQLLIVVDGDVTIADDITYATPYGSTAEIPSLAIIARGNIVINSNVRQLDGALFTQKNLATCDTPGALTATICNNPLVINGLVIAETIALRRTAGADAAASSDPAERFFYGSELFFNNVLIGSDSNQAIINTIEEHDLPPRY